MPRLLLPLTLLAAATAALSQSPATPATAPTGPTPERHEFILHNFHTESGVILPEAHLVYGTYGTLNADRSNAILLLQARTWESKIPPLKAIADSLKVSSRPA